jgi:hypothetical protein
MWNEDLEMMLWLIRHVIGCIKLRLFNGPVFLGNPLGNWPVGEPEERRNMF